MSVLRLLPRAHRRLPSRHNLRHDDPGNPNTLRSNSLGPSCATLGAVPCAGASCAQLCIGGLRSILTLHFGRDQHDPRPNSSLDPSGVSRSAGAVTRSCLVFRLYGFLKNPGLLKRQPRPIIAASCMDMCAGAPAHIARAPPPVLLYSSSAVVGCPLPCKFNRVCLLVLLEDACYDRGSSFRLKRFPNDGAP